ncbi:MAG: hypothetical protein AAGE92_05095, partial [Cyanobacteria bacterium P01_G01_bin.4]
IAGDQSLFFFPSEIFARRNTSPDILTYLSIVPPYILFYLACFGLKNNPFSVFRGEHEKAAK